MISKGKVFKCPSCKEVFCEAMKDMKYGESLAESCIKGERKALFTGDKLECDLCHCDFSTAVMRIEWWGDR